MDDEKPALNTEKNGIALMKTEKKETVRWQKALDDVIHKLHTKCIYFFQ